MVVGSGNKDYIFICILILTDIIQDWGLYPKPKSCQGIGWVMLNSVVAVCDRLLQRLLLSKDVFGFRALAQAQQSVPPKASVSCRHKEGDQI